MCSSILRATGFSPTGLRVFGKFEEARGLVKEMRDRGMKVDASLYNLVIRSCCSSTVGCMEKASSVFNEMAKRNVTPNSDTYWPLVLGFCEDGEMEKAMRSASAMQRKGIQLDGVVLRYLDRWFLQ